MERNPVPATCYVKDQAGARNGNNHVFPLMDSPDFSHAPVAPMSCAFGTSTSLLLLWVMQATSSLLPAAPSHFQRDHQPSTGRDCFLYLSFHLLCLCIILLINVHEEVTMPLHNEPSLHSQFIEMGITAVSPGLQTILAFCLYGVFCSKLLHKAVNKNTFSASCIWVR